MSDVTLRVRLSMTLQEHISECIVKKKSSGVVKFLPHGIVDEQMLMLIAKYRSLSGADSAAHWWTDCRQVPYF